MSWKRDQIAEAILANACVDGSGQALHGKPGVTAATFIPPTGKMAAEVLRNADWMPSATGAVLSIGEFEQLSLRARRIVLDRLPAERSGLPVLSARDIEAALADVADKIDFDQSGAAHGINGDGEDASDTDLQRLLSRRGLQVVGCYIKGDIVLVNARLPFSVRFIGCVIEGAVVVDHCALTTLDLSGSVVRGVHASFLKAAGSVRLRRTVSTGPIDLGGAKIGGLFDLSDAIVMPFDPPPPSEAFAGDRGAVNLSLATLDNECHCARARIYGGLNLRGATIQRSLFMDQACLFSPVGTLERMLAELAMSGARANETPPHSVAARNADAALARAAREGDADDERKPDLEAESMAPLLKTGDPLPVFSRLILESVRARTAALRADGARIEGSVFARRLYAAGRLRLKYARIGGGLHLNGSKLRSIQHIDANLHAESLFDYRRDNRRFGPPSKGLVHLVAGDVRGERLASLRSARPMDESQAGERTQDALDLREATIAGQLEMQPYRTNSATTATAVHGVVALAGATIHGDVQMQDVWFCRRVCEGTGEAPKDARGAATETGQFPEPGLYLSRAVIGGSVNLNRSDELYGVLAVGLVARGGFLMAGRPRQHEVTGKWEDQVPERAIRVTGKFDFTNAKIGSDMMLLFAPDTGPSLDLQHAEIAGRLTIAPARATYVTLNTFYNQANKRAEKERKRALKVVGSSAFFELTRNVRQIDLRQAYARVISHAPSAWPHQNGLLISGFRYDSYRGIGPLMSEEELVGGRERPVSRALTLFLAVLVMIVMPGLIVVILSGAGDELGQRVNASAAVCIVGLVIFTWLLRWGRKRAPSMAIRWLALQRLERHPTRPMVSQPLEPYVRAARVLRAAGEHRAANKVELRRLQLRESARGWDTAPVSKLFLKSVDLVSRYGYGLGRTVAWVAASIVLAAGAFQYAHTLGLMQPDKDMGGRPTFVSLVYATDLVIPFIGLSHETAWRPAQPCTREELKTLQDEHRRAERAKEEAARNAGEPAKKGAGALTSPAAIVTVQEGHDWSITCYATADAPTKVQILVYLEWAFRILGLFLCSIIAAAITARAETALARIDD